MEPSRRPWSLQNLSTEIASVRGCPSLDLNFFSVHSRFKTLSMFEHHKWFRKEYIYIHILYIRKETRKMRPPVKWPYLPFFISIFFYFLTKTKHNLNQKCPGVSGMAKEFTCHNWSAHYSLTMPKEMTCWDVHQCTPLTHCKQVQASRE